MNYALTARLFLLLLGTRDSIPSEALCACAHEAARSVGAESIVITVVATSSALIEVCSKNQFFMSSHSCTRQLWE